MTDEQAIAVFLAKNKAEVCPPADANATSLRELNQRVEREGTLVVNRAEDCLRNAEDPHNEREKEEQRAEHEAEARAEYYMEEAFRRGGRIG